MKRAILFSTIVLLTACSNDSSSPQPQPIPEPEPIPVPPAVCEWDETLAADDPNCVEPPPPEPCEWDETLTADDPECVEPPPPPPPPEPCPWDENLVIDDPACVEPPPPEPCPWDENLVIDDPACVEPPPSTCDITLTWTNPTHREKDENGYSKPLEADELAKLTVYAGRIPLAPEEELTFIMDISEVYALAWTLFDMEVGLWYFRATVTDTQGLQSEKSTETSKVC